MDISLYYNGEVLLRSSLVNSVLVVLILSIIFIIGGLKVKKADPSKPPKGIVFFMELFVTLVEGFVSAVMGEKHVGFSPYIGMLASYLAVANLTGLIGLTPPTTDYNVTLALALLTITVIAVSGIRAKGIGKYLKDVYLGAVPFLLPLNIISEISRPISLSFRLFGNILSGAIIIALVSGFAGWFSLPFLPFLNVYFDIFAGLIQTMIFCMLTMIWSQGAMD